MYDASYSSELIEHTTLAVLIFCRPHLQEVRRKPKSYIDRKTEEGIEVCAFFDCPYSPERSVRGDPYLLTAPSEIRVRSAESVVWAVHADLIGHCHLARCVAVRNTMPMAMPLLVEPHPRI